MWTGVLTLHKSSCTAKKIGYTIIPTNLSFVLCPVKLLLTSKNICLLIFLDFISIFLQCCSKLLLYSRPLGDIILFESCTHMLTQCTYVQRHSWYSTNICLWVVSLPHSLLPLLWLNLFGALEKRRNPSLSWRLFFKCLFLF